MARETLASLRAANEVLRAKNAELEALLVRTASLVPKQRAWPNAATLIINDVPRVTYRTHSEAFKAMQRARDRGHRAMYAPVRA